MQDIKDLNQPVNSNYAKFFAKFEEIENLQVSDWKNVHVLAYFCKKYKEYYNLNYTFKFNNPAPSKCFETWQIKKLASQLSSDPAILKEYLDWLFKTKVIERKKRITSMGYITTTEIVNEYKFKFLFSQLAVERSTNLPNYVIEVIKPFNDQVLTYGDLAFIYKSFQLNNSYANIFAELSKIGFKTNILDTLK